jgi:hypothetical protein
MYGRAAELAEQRQQTINAFFATIKDIAEGRVKPEQIFIVTGIGGQPTGYRLKTPEELAAKAE